MDNFSGILFTLKKRERGLEVNDLDYYKYIILGYNDGLDIHIVDKWYDLRPKGLKDRKLQVELDSPFIDQYTIRALLPSKKRKNDLNKKGFAYRLWEKIGRGGDFSQNQINKLKKAPFICMSALNFSESFVREQKNFNSMMNAIEELLTESIEDAGYKLKDVNCAFFPTIGYTDCVLVFLVDNLKKARAIIDRVKEKKVIREKAEEIVRKEDTVISSCYSTCGVDKNFIEDIQETQDDILVNIQIQLKRGISSEAFFDKFDEIAQGMLIDKSEDCCGAFGNTDCCIFSVKSLKKYLQWHQSGQILNPENDFFKKNIEEIRTMVCVRPDNQRKNLIPIDLEDRGLQYYEKLFEEFLENYGRDLENKDMHIRNSRALQQTMRKFVSLAKYSHAFDARYVIGEAFECFIKGFESIGKLISNLEELKKSEELSNYIKNIETTRESALEYFEGYIDDLLADLLRSDTMFIADNSLIHSRISSAAKLLFVYSELLNKLTIKYNEPNFRFIVSSGGCDKTEAMELFPFVCKEEVIEKLIIITIPEASLYDVQGNLFRIIHECLHFIGDRKREARFTYIIETLAEYIAWDICQYEFNEERLEEIKEKVEVYIEDKTIIDNIEDKINEIYKKLQNEVIDELIERFSLSTIFKEYKEENKGEENFFYAHNLKETVLDSLEIFKIFNGKKDEKELSNGLENEIYKIFYNTDYKLMTQIDDVLNELLDKESNEANKNRLRMTKVGFAGVLIDYESDVEEGREDEVTKSFVSQYLNRLFENYIFGADEKFLNEVIPYIALRDCIMFVMTECFSDIGAIRIMNIKPEDFLLSFIYEVWDMDQAFPLNLENVLRIGIDLKLGFGIEGKLGMDIERKIKGKANLRKKQGYEYHNVNKMIEQINEILKAYQSEEGKIISRQIERYLRECFANPKEWYMPEIGNLYQDSNMETSDMTYQMIKQIIDLWKGMGAKKYESK